MAVFDPMPNFAILALTNDQIRMLAVYPRVPMTYDGIDERAWARMADLPLQRVRDLSRGLMEMGAILPDRSMPKIVTAYLAKLSADLVK